MTGTPGPGNIASMALGQAVGFKRSIPFLSGVIIGGMTMDILAAIGLAELFWLTRRYPLFSRSEVLSISYTSLGRY